MVAGVVTLLLASGCGGIEPTEVRGADRAACESLVESLPSRVAGQELVVREPDIPGASWGDPAIVLRCGVGRPDGYDPLAQCQTVDGMGWFVPEEGQNDQSVDVVMTAISRTPAVEVTLPAEYRPPVEAMVDLADAIEEHTRPTRRCP